MVRRRDIEPNSYNDDKDYENNLEATRDILGYYPPTCPHCGDTMKFNFSTNIFKCFSCGYTADEEDGENMAYSDDYDSIFGKPSEDEKPESCIACGGPWPSCKSSCKIFDE